MGFDEIMAYRDSNQYDAPEAAVDDDRATRVLAASRADVEVLRREFRAFKKGAEYVFAGLGACILILGYLVVKSGL